MQPWPTFAGKNSIKVPASANHRCLAVDLASRHQQPQLVGLQPRECPRLIHRPSKGLAHEIARTRGLAVLAGFTGLFNQTLPFDIRTDSHGLVVARIVANPKIDAAVAAHNNELVTTHIVAQGAQAPLPRPLHIEPILPAVGQILR